MKSNELLRGRISERLSKLRESLVVTIEGRGGREGLPQALLGVSEALCSVASDHDGGSEPTSAGMDEQDAVRSLGTKRAAREIVGGTRSTIGERIGGKSPIGVPIDRHNSVVEDDVASGSAPGTEKAALVFDLKQAISIALGRS
jgi:hypothetical protein